MANKLSQEEFEVLQPDATKLKATVWQAEKDRIITSSVLPEGAATEATLLAIKSKTDNLDVLLSTRATNETRDAEGHPQVDVLTTANPPNLDVALSTRASEATQARTDVESAAGIFSKRVDIRYDNVGLAKDRTTATNFHAVRITDGTTFIDPRNIRTLTSTDVVTVVQPTADNLKALVTQAEKDRVITDVTKVSIPVSITATAAGTTAIWTPAAGKKLRIKFIMVFNSGTGTVTVDLRFTTTGVARFKAALAANTGYVINLIGCNWEGGVDQALFVNLSTAGTIDVTVLGEEV